MGFPFRSSVVQSERSSVNSVGPSSSSSFRASAALVSSVFELAICCWSSVSMRLTNRLSGSMVTSSLSVSPSGM